MEAYAALSQSTSAARLLFDRPTGVSHCTFAGNDNFADPFLVCMQAYKAALALYELPTAYMLIAASQRDPAEYLAELQVPHLPTQCLCAAAQRFELAALTCALRCRILGIVQS